MLTKKKVCLLWGIERLGANPSHDVTTCLVILAKRKI